MFVLNVYLARPLTKNDAQELLDLVKRSVEKKGLPFGSHSIHLGNTGEDTYAAFKMLSNAGANVSLIECKSDYAVLVGTGHIRHNHKQMLYLP